MWITAIVAAVLLMAQGAGAQCQGDFNDNGTVEVNEIIIAVNNLLEGCPMVDGCPIDFSDDNTQPGTPDCYYSGRWNPNCGSDDLESLWRSDGEFVIVEFLGFPDNLFYGAEVTSATEADLIGWFTQEDASDLEPAPGSLVLGDSGQLLTLTPDVAPFQVDECDFARYPATLVEVVTPTARAAALRRVDASAFERLRAARKARAPKPNLQRK